MPGCRALAGPAARREMSGSCPRWPLVQLLRSCPAWQRGRHCQGPGLAARLWLPALGDRLPPPSVVLELGFPGVPCPSCSPSAVPREPCSPSHWVRGCSISRPPPPPVLCLGAEWCFQPGSPPQPSLCHGSLPTAGIPGDGWVTCGSGPGAVLSQNIPRKTSFRGLFNSRQPSWEVRTSLHLFKDIPSQLNPCMG